MAFLVLGESLIDVVSSPGVNDRAIPGGSPMNVAVGLARLAQEAALVTHIGSDANGELIRDHLRSNGVLMFASSLHDSPTSLAHATIGDDGSATYEFNITWDVAGQLRAAAQAIPHPAAVHAGSIAAFLQPGSTEVYETFVSAHEKTVTTFDPNCRPSIIGERDEASAVVERFVASSDVVKASDEDIRWLYPDTGYRSVAEQWLDLGASMVVITRGSEGVWCRTSSGQIMDIPSTHIDVVDTVGAGDSYMSALLFGLANTGMVGAEGKARLRTAGRDALLTVLRQAARAASITCTRSGALPPTMEELLATQPSDLLSASPLGRSLTLPSA